MAVTHHGSGVIVVVSGISDEGLLWPSVPVKPAEFLPTLFVRFTPFCTGSGLSLSKMENLDELPFFRQHKIAKATNNFISHYKIGEGGFGPVYKVTYGCFDTLTYEDDIGFQMENLDELPFFRQHKIAKATNNFISHYKIGEGGFGPVYKGVLEDGQVIAVKRLLETSEQGLDELKDEVIWFFQETIATENLFQEKNQKVVTYLFLITPPSQGSELS
ncbi:unnamed protein product [Lactuca virosa]|uniref:Protein kinase domain-containing protein n=1 Tax=Lactuca virosa TaxID=75947 RepID=A0AAU9NYJ7_9ASTR|nr:unnamed protein product [Lactuca virosa]